MKNNEIVRKAAIDTAAVSAGQGILSPEQSKQFLAEAMDSTPLMQAVRHEMRKARRGYINKIGVGRRQMRAKTEGVDDSDPKSPTFSDVEYNTVAVRLDWDINGEVLRENIEGASLEGKITSLMTSAVGIDLEDLAINADTATAAGDQDYDFLKVNNGWLKLLNGGSHVVDRSNINSGAMALNVYYSALRELPNKYHKADKLRWIMSPNRQAQWEEYLLNQAITAGGIVTDRRIENPAAVPSMAVTNMPDDRIILTDPKNLILVNTYDMIINHDNSSKDAIRQDKTFYVVHLDFDSIIEELDAAVLIKGLAQI